MNVYSNMLLESFISHFEGLLGIPFDQICIKVADDTQIRRVEKLTVDAKTGNKTTLNDVKIQENSAILVEVNLVV